MTRPGHGLDEYLAYLNALPRELHVTHRITRDIRNTDGVAAGTDLRTLAKAVSRELARLEDEEGW